MTRASLSPQQVDTYRTQGCLFPLAAMSSGQAGAYIRVLEGFEAEHGPRAAEILRSKSHLVLPWANELVRLQPVLDAVESLIGPDIYCWGSSFFIKKAGDPGFIAWHQDAPYSGMPKGEGAEIVTAWIALSASNVANGCLKVVPGSHKALVPHEYREDKANLLSLGQEIAVTVDEADAARIELAPGQFSFHHEMIIHGSEPNRSDARRVGFAVRYVRPFARNERKDTDTATLVRGEDRLDCFHQEPSPRSPMDPAAVQYLDALLTRKSGNRYRKAAQA